MTLTLVGIYVGTAAIAWATNKAFDLAGSAVASGAKFAANKAQQSLGFRDPNGEEVMGTFEEALALH